MSDLGRSLIRAEWTFVMQAQITKRIWSSQESVREEKFLSKAQHMESKSIL
jgi:hypothetical protein